MGETRVDLLHLLEDLRDAYPGAIEETILTEMVANSLDSGAKLVAIRCEPALASVTVIDDGSGMQRRELARYHDIAASTKTRGQGIGFAGVGIKLGLLLCEEVLTETRRGKSQVATRWHLASKNKAPWKWVPPPALVGERGTAVRLRLANPLSPLLDAGFVEGALRRHFEPLLDPAFDALLGKHYTQGVRFEVNGRVLDREVVDVTERAGLEVRFTRKRRPSALGTIFRDARPLPEERRGIAISTLGKVIKRGWDWLGVTPVTPDRIGGLIEAPALAECLTLNKADFIRSGPRGATYLAYRKAIQQSVSRQLAVWGDAREIAEETRRRVARPVERDLERVLVDLADDYPLLASLVERHEGGQRKLPIGSAAASGRQLVASSIAAALAGNGHGNTTVDEVRAEAADAAAPDPEQAIATESEPQPLPEADTRASLPASGGARRPGRYGLTIQFESREDDAELGRLVDSTIWVNEAHAAYRRALASRSEGYHIALSVALALAPLAVEPSQEHAFVTAFLARWGEALTSDAPRRRR